MYVVCMHCQFSHQDFQIPMVSLGRLPNSKEKNKRRRLRRLARSRGLERAGESEDEED